MSKLLLRYHVRDLFILVFFISITLAAIRIALSGHLPFKVFVAALCFGGGSCGAMCGWLVARAKSDGRRVSDLGSYIRVGIAVGIVAAFLFACAFGGMIMPQYTKRPI